MKARQQQLFEVVARDEALQKVSENAGTFSERVAWAVNGHFEPGALITGEDIRLILSTVYGIVPHHHNAWGAAVMGLVRRGILIDTSTTRKMRAPGSHARKTTVYRKR